jgi:hypothetical protein
MALSSPFRTLVRALHKRLNIEFPMKTPRGWARGANAGPHNFAAAAASATSDEHSAASAMMEAASASVEDQAVTWGSQGQGVRKV